MTTTAISSMWPTSASDGPPAVPGTRTHELPSASEETSPTVGGGLAPDGGDGALLSGGAGRRQQAFEQLGERHGERHYLRPFALAPR